MDTNIKNNEDIQPLSPEEIKAIGEIAIGPSKHEQFLNAHYKKLMWGGITLGIAAGCVIAFFSHRNDMRKDAAAQVVQAGYALNVEAERKLASLDALAALCASRATDDDAYATDLRALLLMQDDITMSDRVISWKHTDGRRTLNCAVTLNPLGGEKRLDWVTHSLTATTEDTWN